MEGKGFGARCLRSTAAFHLTVPINWYGNGSYGKGYGQSQESKHLKSPGHRP